MKYSTAAYITGFCSIVAGLLHASIVAMQHWTPFPPLEGMFFIVGGAVQCLLGIHFLRQPTMRTYRLGLSLNGGMAMLCFIMLYLPVPFVGETESMGPLALIVVALELISVGASLRWLLTHTEHGKGKALHTTSAAALSFMILWGAGFYGGGQGAALLMPDRSVGHSHGESSAHPHSKDENGHQEKGNTEPLEDNHYDENDPDHGH